MCGATASADITVLPVSASTVDQQYFNFSLFNSTSRRYQSIYGETALAGLPTGSVITGISMRADKPRSYWTTSGWPIGPLTTPQLTVKLGRASRVPADMSPIFDNNVDGYLVTVFSGSWTWPSGSFPTTSVTSAPHPFGIMLPLTTPYIYLGGPLLVEFVHAGYLISEGAYGLEVDAGGQDTAVCSATPSTQTLSSGVGIAGAIVLQVTFQPPLPDAFQRGISKVLVLGDVANRRAGGSTTEVLIKGARTVQFAVGENEFAGLGRGSILTGVGFRAGGTAGWPAPAANFTRYDIELSRALNAPGSLDATVGNNAGADAVLVRSGPLTISNTMPGQSLQNQRPAKLGMEIPFAVPYTYDGGGLHGVLRIDGTGIASSGNVDAIRTSDPLYGERIRAKTAVGADAASTPTDLAFPVQRWSVDAAVRVPAGVTNVASATQPTDATLGGESTLQVAVSASELAAVPIGSKITGLALRGSSEWPSSGASFSRFEVRVSTGAKRPGAMSTIFAENDGADSVLVRSASLVIGAAKVGPAQPGSRDDYILWFHRSFPYRGGDLVFTLRQEKQSASGTVRLEGVPASASIGAVSAAGFGAVEGTKLANVPTVRVHYTPAVTVPKALTFGPGDSNFAFFNGPGVFQVVYDESQLRNLRVGSVVTGMSVRQSSTVPGLIGNPQGDSSSSRFDVTISTAARSAAEMSDTFAANIGSDAVLVRSGTMAIPNYAFPAVGSATQACDHRWFMDFTEPFVYKGGSLCVTIRYAGLGITCDADSLHPSLGASRRNLGSADATVHNQGAERAVPAIAFSFVPRDVCRADMTNDGVVDDGDFVLFLADYGVLDCAEVAMEIGCPADLNFDRLVDDLDFQVFIGAYNELLCP